MGHADDDHPGPQTTRILVKSEEEESDVGEEPRYRCSVKLIRVEHGEATEAERRGIAARRSIGNRAAGEKKDRSEDKRAGDRDEIGRMYRCKG